MTNIKRISDRELIPQIKELHNAFGTIREDFNMHHFRWAFSQKEYTKCIALVQEYMNIPFVLKVGYVNNGGPKEQKDVSIWVSVPENLHEYSNQSKIQYLNANNPITIYIRKSFLNEFLSPELFAYAIAHELGHIVLRHIRHSLRDSEPAVDLTAMIMGFSIPFVIGRRQTITGKNSFDSLQRHSLWGYLTEEQSYVANLFISRLQVDQALKEENNN